MKKARRYEELHVKEEGSKDSRKAILHRFSHLNTHTHTHTYNNAENI